MGVRAGMRGKETPCDCVFRAIFRICHARFRRCIQSEPHMSWSHNERRIRSGNGSAAGRSLSAASGRPVRARYGYPDQEYMADFLAIAKRVLGERTREHRVFRWHFLYGADFRLVNRKLGRPPGDRIVFHDFYRIEARLGRAFAECEPYGLYPLDEYFGGAVRGRKAEIQTGIALPATAF